MKPFTLRDAQPAAVEGTPVCPGCTAPPASPPRSLQPPTFSKEMGGRGKHGCALLCFTPEGSGCCWRSLCRDGRDLRSPQGDASGEGKTAQSPFTCGRSTREGMWSSWRVCDGSGASAGKGKLGPSPMEKWGCPHLLVGNQFEGVYIPTQALRRRQHCQKRGHGEVKGCPSSAQRDGGKALAEPGGPPGHGLSLPAPTSSVPPQRSRFPPEDVAENLHHQLPRSVSGESLLENVTHENISHRNLIYL